MSSLDHSLAATTDRRLSVVTDTAANLIAQLSEFDRRLSVVTDTAANLNAQLCELNLLRERVRKAELASRRRFTAEKRARIRWPELRSR